MRLPFALLALTAVTVLGAPTQPQQPGSFKLPVTHDPIPGLLTVDGSLRPGITALLGARIKVAAVLRRDGDDNDLHRRDGLNDAWPKTLHERHEDNVDSDLQTRGFSLQPWRRDEEHVEGRSFTSRPWFKWKRQEHLEARTFTSRPWFKWKRDEEHLEARTFTSRPWFKWKRRVETIVDRTFLSSAWKKWRRDSTAGAVRRAQHPFSSGSNGSSAIHDEGWGIVVTPTENSDGDNEWLVELDVGTPPQKLSVVLDTGSSATWVYSPSCCYSTTHRFFDPLRSSTFSNRTVDANDKPVRAARGAPGQLWSQQYARGRRIEGSLGIDTIGFSSGDGSKGGSMLNLVSSTIALATDVIGQSRESRKMEGLVGLAPGSANGVDGGWPNPLELAAERGLLKYPYLTATLVAANRSDGKNGGGHYVIGDVDEERSRGDAVFQATSSTAFWGAEYDEGGLALGDKRLTDGNPERRYIIDTGTAVISLPGDMATAAHASIAGSLWPTKGNFVGYWLVPCNVGQPQHEASLPPKQRTPNLSITILRHTFRVPAHDLVFQSYYPVPSEDAGGKSGMCISGIQKASSYDFIVLGLSFIKNHVVTFDFGSLPRRQRRIGIASRTDLPILSG